MLFQVLPLRVSAVVVSVLVEPTAVVKSPLPVSVPPLQLKLPATPTAPLPPSVPPLKFSGVDVPKL